MYRFWNNAPTNLEKFPVTIGHIPPPEQFNDVLISLKEDVPEYATQFQRIMEPIDADSRDIEKAKIPICKIYFSVWN